MDCSALSVARLLTPSMQAGHQRYQTGERPGIVTKCFRSIKIGRFVNKKAFESMLASLAVCYLKC